MSTTSKEPTKIKLDIAIEVEVEEIDSKIIDFKKLLERVIPKEIALTQADPISKTPVKQGACKITDIYLKRAKILNT